MEINCTLLCDGSSDQMLIPAIKWLLVQHFPEVPFNFEFTHVKEANLSERICLSIELYPCDILFIHRDTEEKSFDIRLTEINENQKKAKCNLPKVIAVIPKRMSEAWLLFDEHAIRRASGNVNGKVDLQLPKIDTLESITDPKSVLISLLKTATELSKRRRKKFSPHAAIHVIPETIEDYSPLRALKSFQLLEEEIAKLDLNNE